MKDKYPKYFIPLDEYYYNRVYKIESEGFIFRVIEGKKEKVLYPEAFWAILNNPKLFKEIPACEFALLSS